MYRIRIHIQIPILMHLHLHIHIHIHIDIHIHLRIHMHMHIHMYIHWHRHRHKHQHIKTHTYSIALHYIALHYIRWQITLYYITSHTIRPSVPTLPLGLASENLTLPFVKNCLAWVVIFHSISDDTSTGGPRLTTRVHNSHSSHSTEWLLKPKDLPTASTENRMPKNSMVIAKLFPPRVRP